MANSRGDCADPDAAAPFAPAHADSSVSAEEAATVAAAVVAYRMAAVAAADVLEGNAAQFAPAQSFVLGNYKRFYCYCCYYYCSYYCWRCFC